MMAVFHAAIYPLHVPVPRTLIPIVLVARYRLWCDYGLHCRGTTMAWSQTDNQLRDINIFFRFSKPRNGVHCFTEYSRHRCDNMITTRGFSWQRGTGRTDRQDSLLAWPFKMCIQRNIASRLTYSQLMFSSRQYFLIPTLDTVRSWKETDAAVRTIFIYIYNHRSKLYIPAVNFQIFLHGVESSGPASCFVFIMLCIYYGDNLLYREGIAKNVLLKSKTLFLKLYFLALFRSRDVTFTRWYDRKSIFSRSVRQLNGCFDLLDANTAEPNVEELMSAGESACRTRPFSTDSHVRDDRPRAKPHVDNPVIRY